MQTISVSSINDFQRCQLRWCFRWLEKRVPRREPTALTVGKMIHSAFDEHFSPGEEWASPGHWLEHLLENLEHTLMTEYEEKAVKEVENLTEPLKHWQDLYPVSHTLETEQAFEMPLPNGIIFQGRPDRVVLVNDHVFHMQHKTISAQRNLDTYISVARRSMHELLYGLVLAEKYPDHPYGGTIYNIVRKLKHKSQAKGKNFGKVLHEPEEFFLQTVIPIDKVLQQTALMDLKILSNQMKDIAKAYPSYKPPSTRAEDEDMFSKREDPYFGVLTGEKSLSDDLLFMDKEDLYAV